jgi:hypothetical protein
MSAQVYIVAGLDNTAQKKPGTAFSNLSKLYRAIKLAAGESIVYHGTPDMDSWRVIRVNSYQALRKAATRDNWESVGLYWSDHGAYRVISFTRLQLNNYLSK